MSNDLNFSNNILTMKGLILLLLLQCCASYLTFASFSDVKSGSTTSLKEGLQKFVGARNHKTNPVGKTNARNYIREQFMKADLHTWTEKIDINGLQGENIVGIFRGKNTGKAQDKLVIVGAHYDTDKTENTTGVDDNGSGVTAMLEVAKQIGKAKLVFNHTVMFVAFDFEEWTDECNISWAITCGSRDFVKNLTSYLNQTKGTVNGALILETIINHNSTADSQILPKGTEQAVPESYNEVRDDSFRGNFLAVIGRKEPDKKLLSLMKKYFQNDSDYRAQLLPIPLTGKPSDNSMFDDFYRSDHYRFWDNDKPFNALMLTDTADKRGYMQHCYHEQCDNMRLVKDDDLEFLRRTINAVIQTTLELSEAASTSFFPTTTSFFPTTTSKGSSINVVNLLLFIFSTFLAVLN